MKQEMESDLRRIPFLRFVLNDDFASFAFGMLVFGLILLPLLVLAWPEYAILTATIFSLLMILSPHVAISRRFRIVSSLTANGVDIKARVEKIVRLPTSYAAGTPPMLIVTISYRYLGEAYESHFSEAAPTKFASMMAGEEIIVAVDPGKPRRYLVRDRQYPRLGHSRVVSTR